MATRRVRVFTGTAPAFAWLTPRWAKYDCRFAAEHNRKKRQGDTIVVREQRTRDC
jgi:hypothetical protein